MLLRRPPRQRSFRACWLHPASRLMPGRGRSSSRASVTISETSEYIRTLTAQQSANEVSASAYTVGNDIVFGAGRYGPKTLEGRRLIAHELTHVIQQHIGSMSGKLIQRAQIPHRQITWTDFKASPPDTKNAREGAGILSAFDVPSYSRATNAKNTRKKCTIGKTRSTEVEATAAPEPEHLLKPEAYMDQERSWALARYTGDGTIHCASRVNKSDRKVFEKCLSDEVTERARLLKHEQGHFDITKAMAENARASLQLKATSLPVTETGCGEDAARDAARSKYESDVRPILRDLGKNWQKSKDLAQDDYDTKTGHGAKAAEQKAWEGKIQSGLKDYDPTILPAPTPAVPAKPAAPPVQTKSPVTPSPGMQARLYTAEPAAVNSAREDDSIHQPQVDEFRRREDELGNPAAARGERRGDQISRPWSGLPGEHGSGSGRRPDAGGTWRRVSHRLRSNGGDESPSRRAHLGWHAHCGNGRASLEYMPRQFRSDFRMYWREHFHRRRCRSLRSHRRSARAGEPIL